MKGITDAEYITPLVFMVVMGTVLLNATTARLFAKIAGVFLKRSDGILIVGASHFSRLIATYLKNNNRRVVLIDSNSKSIEKSEAMGFEAIDGNIYSEELIEDIELNDVGFLLALTASATINKFAIDKYGPIFGERGSFRLISTEELLNKTPLDNEHLFTDRDDYINLSEIVRDFPYINEVTIDSAKHYKDTLKKINEELHAVPMFLKDEVGFIHIISSLGKNFKIEKGNVLMYIGKKIV